MPFFPNYQSSQGAYAPDTIQLKVHEDQCPAAGDGYCVTLHWNKDQGMWLPDASPTAGGDINVKLAASSDGTITLIPPGIGGAWDLTYHYDQFFYAPPYGYFNYLRQLEITGTVSQSYCHGNTASGVIILEYGIQLKETAPACQCDCNCNQGSPAGSGGGGDGSPKTSSIPVRPKEASGGPIRYSTGEILLQVDDLGSGGFGAPWGHTRSFSSQLGYHQDFGQGYNWQVAQWPALISTSDSLSVVVMGRASQPLWFGLAGGSALFGLPHTFAYDPQVDVFRLSDPDGSLTEFNGQTRLFARHFDPAGNKTQVIAYDNTLPSEVQRSHTDASGNQTTESYLYAFANGADSLRRVTSVTLRRQVNGGAWQNVRRALYTYYDGASPFGWFGDLKTVVTQTWENSAWADLGTTLYRYALPPAFAASSSSSAHSSSSGSSSGALGNPWGAAHLLKYVVNPASYTKLAADPSSGGDPTTAPNWVVAMYADNYFEYDDSGRAVREMLEGGSRSYSYAYSASSFAGSTDFNVWVAKTVETLPGGTQNVTYANFAGQVMLSVKIPGAGQPGDGPWYDFYRYDSAGRLVLKAESSAITGYDEQYADLLHCVSSGASSTSSGCNCPQLCSGYFQYLSDHEGLIHLYDYDTASGNVIRERIRNGEFGCDNKLWERTFQAFSATAAYDTPVSSSSSSSSSAHTSSSSASRSSSSSGSSGTTVTAYLLTQSIQYPDDILIDPAQSKQIITSYSYTFFPGTVRVQSRTTTWPVVSTDQNGSGVADNRVEYFDVYSNPTWAKDERGFLTRQRYDPVTGGHLQSIQDVDTTQTNDQPTGWSTPVGGGLHLVTDFTVDNLGRTTQVLGPSHEIDLAGTATTIRRATWSVYLDSEFQRYSGQGYATGTAPSYSYTLVNPVGIAKFDQAGRVLEQISAIRSSTAGALSASDSFAQSSYCRWTTNQYTDCCKQASSRVYFDIPTSGEGSVSVNYNETDFGYDFLNRRNRVVSPGGTITRTVFDARNQPIAFYVGTNDTGASASDPTGSGASGNNMVVVTEYQYDGGSAGGDGNSTQETQHVDATTSRVTFYGYDYRNRRASTDGEIDFYQAVTYDNLNRTLQLDRHDTTAAGNLVARSKTTYDDRGRVYQSRRYAIDPSTGSAGNSLVDNTWYDPSGQVIKQLPSGSSAFTKTIYDGAGRQAANYFGYDLGASEPNYASAPDISDDTVVEQTEILYDAASNMIQTAFRQRYHDSTGVGALNTPGGAQPKARITYVVMYPDAVGRPQATANYGTNDNVSLSRPSTIPTRADTVLVTSTVYDSRGDAYQTVDPTGRVDQTIFDDAGRKICQIDNVVPSSSSSSSSSGSAYDMPPSDDKNRTTLWTYTAEGTVSTLTALNSATGSQMTQYVYGTTLVGSDIARNDLLRAVIYPDSDDAANPLGNGPDGLYDRVEHTYNRQGQMTQTTDQNQTVHVFDFDLLGRQVQDRVISFLMSSNSSSSSSSGPPSGIDSTVQRIGRTYEVRGLPLNVTSYSSPIVGQGKVVNDVQFAYNSFGRLVAEFQEHSGGVSTTTSVQVQYAYAEGSANTIRPTSLTYPNGRVLNYSYGATGTVDDALSRVAGLIDNDGLTHLVDYTRLGRNRFVQQSSPQPQIAWSLINGVGKDPYSGLDQFSRIVDNRWYSTASSSSSSNSSSGIPFNADLDRIQHGYDRASNRLWRKNTVAETASIYLDELYAYNGMYELVRLDRGQLSTWNAGILPGTLDYSQAWGLDATGNWQAYREDSGGAGSWSLAQSRTSDRFNQITAISGGGWAEPFYDAAGSMTTMPQPTAPSDDYVATYDAWNRLTLLLSGGTIIGKYAYDGTTRRTTKTVSGSTRHLYYSAKWQILEERIGTSSAVDRQFVWGQRYVDSLVLRDRGDERLYSLQDPNRNVTTILDDSGVIRERYHFAPYGIPAIFTGTFMDLTSTNVDWEIRFAGYYWDGESGLHCVRHRSYHSSLGAWCHRDPYTVAPLSLDDPLFLNGLQKASLVLTWPVSVFAYVANNPLSHIDSLGLFDEKTDDDKTDDEKDTTVTDIIEMLQKLKEIIEIGKAITDNRFLKPLEAFTKRFGAECLLEEQLFAYIATLNEFQPATSCGKWYKATACAIIASGAYCDNQYCSAIESKEGVGSGYADNCYISLFNIGKNGPASKWQLFARKLAQDCSELSMKSKNCTCGSKITPKEPPSCWSK